MIVIPAHLVCACGAVRTNDTIFHHPDYEWKHGRTLACSDCIKASPFDFDEALSLKDIAMLCGRLHEQQLLSVVGVQPPAE